MQVEVRLFAGLRKYLTARKIGEPSYVKLGGPGGHSPEGNDTRDGSTKVGDLLAKLGIPPEDAFVVMVNGRRQELGWTLQDGDRVGIFPPIGGG